MLNITVAGRLTKDAESKEVSGKNVTNFTVACDVGFGDNKHAVFVSCAGWGDRWKKVADYLVKGIAVTVVGAGDLRTWDSNGKSGSEIRLDVQELTLQSKKAEGVAPAQKQSQDDGSLLDDEIPF